MCGLSNPGSLVFNITKTVSMLNNNFIFKSGKTGWIISKKQGTKYKGIPDYPSMSPNGLFWKPDGLNLYITDNAWDRVYHFSFSVAWDITSTMTYVGMLGVGSETGSATNGITFSPDGIKMFVTSYGSGKITLYNLSTAWLPSSYYSSMVQFILPGVPTTGNVFESISFTSDGLNLYVSQRNITSKIYQYKLTVPFDLSTATLFKDLTLATPNVAYIKPDGTHLYVLFDYSMVDYKLTTPNDVSTAVSSDTTNVISGSWSTGLTFSPDGFNFYTVNSQYAQLYSAKLA